MTRDEFYRKVDAVAGAAREALKMGLPPDMNQREKKLWTGVLSRLPEQIEDVKANFNDPHLDARRNRDDSGIILP